MATSSKRNDEFCKACSGSEIKGLLVAIWGGLASPNAETVLFRRLSIQLSLGGLLSSRAHLCLAGRPKFNRLVDWVKDRPSGQCLFHLRQRMADQRIPRCLFSLRQQARQRLARVLAESWKSAKLSHSERKRRS